MGQPIVVVEKPSVANPGVVRFETNRALTGMGHERYVADAEVRGDRPPDELARRLFARGGVVAVHVNGNVVTVDLAKGYGTDGLQTIIEDLYTFYPESSEPATEEPAAAAEPIAAEPAAETTAEAAPATDEAPASDAEGADV